MPQKTGVVLIFGGRSAEHDVSLVSASAIYKNLDRAKYTVRSIYISKKGRWKIVKAPSTDPNALSGGKSGDFLPWKRSPEAGNIKADIYFPVLHGPFGEDGTIQGLLEMAGVPYVGAGVLASSLGMDKAVAKSLFKERDLPIPPYLVIQEPEWRDDRSSVLKNIRKSFGLPLFVKPSNLGSSVGITKVKSFSRVAEAIRTAFRYDRKILVEKGIEGRELECSVLGNDLPEASLPGEVIPFREFYDYNDKYLDGKTTFLIPAKLPKSVTARTQRLAVAAFKAVECSGMARVDFFLEKDTNRLFINEINTIPGFTAISMYPKLWSFSGLSFPRLLDRLIALGFERYRNRKACVERDR